tara:strand:- start:363 stop:635 length:273 start_codon:yes stop_codon:yes gene_type:complete
MRASLAAVVLAAALTAHADDLDGWQFRVISVTRAEPAKQEAATVIGEPDKLAAAEPADSGFYVVMFTLSGAARARPTSGRRSHSCGRSPQ